MKGIDWKRGGEAEKMKGEDEAKGPVFRGPGKGGNSDPCQCEEEAENTREKILKGVFVRVCVCSEWCCIG